MSKDFYVEDFVQMALEEKISVKEKNKKFLYELINKILEKYGRSSIFEPFQGVYPDLKDLFDNKYVSQRYISFNEMVDFFEAKQVDNIFIFFDLNDSEKIYYLDNTSDLAKLLKLSYNFDFYVCNEELTLCYAWCRFHILTACSDIF